VARGYGAARLQFRPWGADARTVKPSSGRAPLIAITVACGVLMVASLLQGVVAPASSNRGAPTTGPRLSGAAGSAGLGTPGAHVVGFNGSPTQLPQLDDLGTQIGRAPDIVNFFDGFTSVFPSSGVAQIAASGAEPEVTWEPWDYTLGLNQDTYSLQAIAGGAYDSYITAWAKSAAQFSKPMLLRFAHEMNGNWYPWAIGVNGNTSADYIAAFRHIHDLFVAAGAKNVQWVWCPNIANGESSDMTTEYPGAAYVDVVGIDGYNFGTTPSAWMTPSQIFSSTLALISSQHWGKPVILNEVASVEAGGDKAAWITQLLQLLSSQPQVGGFLWSEFSNWGVETSAASIAAMKSALATYWTVPGPPTSTTTTTTSTSTTSTTTPSSSTTSTTTSTTSPTTPPRHNPVSTLPALNQPIVGMAAAPDGKGYWLVASDGGIFNLTSAGFYGSTGSLHLNQPIVGMASAPGGRGYWLVAADGGIFNFGDAGFYGSTGAIHLNQPIVGMAPTPDGRGYWLVAADGGIFAFGDAGFYGSTGAIHLNQPIRGMAAAPGGRGYWLVAADGGIFNFGTAGYHGSTGGLRSIQPIVGMAATPDGQGYWLVAADGGIFNFGDAGFYGSTGNLRLDRPVVGMAAAPNGDGYWLSTADGVTYSFSST